MRCEIPARRVGHMSFRRAVLPVRSGLFVATTGHLNVVRHLILAGEILMPAALPARAASPPTVRESRSGGHRSEQSQGIHCLYERLMLF